LKLSERGRYRQEGPSHSAERAPDYVFGYTVGNDVTVRDWQQKTPQWMLGKSFDTHCPFGPSIVTTDEIEDPHVLGVRSFVNGELRQNSNTRHLVFNIWQQIAELSQAMTLEPGDLIFTGTPGGAPRGDRQAREHHRQLCRQPHPSGLAATEKMPKRPSACQPPSRRVFKERHRLSRIHSQPCRY
jgi:2-keto-4-pentenoate hydratase/2-oxohepta-3-ene-1,7-dioic acid hydratase in catechol pathway